MTARPLIADGKKARALAAKGQAEGQVTVFKWTDAGYGWPRFYGAECDWPQGHSTGGLLDRLNDAFFELVNKICTAAPADTPADSPAFGKPYKNNRGEMVPQPIPWPAVLATEANYQWQFVIKVLMRQDARDAVSELHEAILAALAAVYQEGKRRGQSMLHGLATGEVSMQDFDESLLTSAERAAADKARRGY